MYILFYHPICPLSRQARVYLKDLNVEFSLVKEDFWARRREFVKKNPAAILPVLDIPNHDITLLGIYPILEYLVETEEKFYYMPKDPNDKASVRHFVEWFNVKFYREVSKILFDEKIIRLLMRAGMPRLSRIKIAKNNLIHHMDYLTSILRSSSFVASESISAADIAAACNISVIDFMGEINWNRWPEVRNWYCLIKSRPSFQLLLEDQLPGFTPPPEYSKLDF